MKIPASLAMLVLLLTGCTSVSTDSRHAADLAKVKHLYVEHRQNDNHALDQLIVTELQSLGYDAACGPTTMMPDNTQGIITYEDQWVFDFTTHMVALDIKVRSAEKDQALGSGHYFNRGVSRVTPEKIVHDVVTSMFKPI
jgi:hypothetical protein